VECATLPNSLNPRNSENSVSDILIRIQFPFESSFWISVSDRNLTILPDGGYPTGKPDSDHLWSVLVGFRHALVSLTCGYFCNHVKSEVSWRSRQSSVKGPTFVCFAEKVLYAVP